MKFLAAIVLGYVLIAGRLGAGINGKSEAGPSLAEGMTSLAVSQLDRALGPALSEEQAPYDPELDAPRRLVVHGGRVVSLAQGCRSVSKPFDLLMHFHGAPHVVEGAFARSGISGALLVVNLGIGSGAYEAPFQGPHGMDLLLLETHQLIKEICPKAVNRTKRIALSGWSAGYGAVSRMLDSSSSAARVDAVLLADGLHTDFELDGYRRVNEAQIKPFALFADQASDGRKLFALTHSSITTTYASTTETSSYLLETEGVARLATKTDGPRPGMLLTSKADRGNFHVLGFAGNDKQAHCDHLHAFGDLLLPYLRERWARR